VTGGLQALLDSLLSLYSQVFSRLLDSRMGSQRESAAPRDAIPIEDLLEEHIERTAAASAKADPGSAGEKNVEARPTPKEKRTAPIPESGRGHSGRGLFGALSNYFGRHRSSAHIEPFMREKMRTNTLDHINKALILARQGEAEGAKIHAGLAQTAMQTAGEYMSDQEFHRFKEQVERRLKDAQHPR
jgi:hypothetical protein